AARRFRPLGRGGVASHGDDGALGARLDGHGEDVVAPGTRRQQPARHVEDGAAVDFDHAHVIFMTIDDEAMHLGHHLPPLSAPAWHVPGRSGTTVQAPPRGTRMVIVPWSA